MNAYPRLLAASSLLLFWVLPISPLISAAALKASRNEQRPAWRKLAFSGAMLSGGFSLAVTAIVVWQVSLLDLSVVWEACVHGLS